MSYAPFHVAWGSSSPIIFTSFTRRCPNEGYRAIFAHVGVLRTMKQSIQHGVNVFEDLCNHAAIRITYNCAAKAHMSAETNTDVSWTVL